jgi:hypothetical protein
MLRASLALIAAALCAQDSPKEATVAVAGGELRYLYAPAAATGAPLLVVLPGVADGPSVRKLFEQWQPLAASRGWSCVIPFVDGVSDPAVKVVDLILTDARKRIPGVDETRVYLAAGGAGVAELFYMLSRAPDLWTAALAIQGSPGAAINSYRLFGANTQETPLLWVAPAADVDVYRAKLSAAEFNFEARPEAKTGEALDWLAGHRRAPFPATVDCETGNPSLARCYWIEMTRFDPKRRNDVLKSTRVLPGSGASLALGPFGYDGAAPGPGALVAWLPANYQGPLKLDDRIVSVDGKEMRDGRDYARQMDEIKDDKSVAVLVQRGKERLRLETKIVLPKREELVTARVQGRYMAEQKELLIISRAVTQMRVRIPAEWTPVSVSWNGLDLLKADAAGCWVLTIEKDPPEVARCP